MKLLLSILFLVYLLNCTFVLSTPVDRCSNVRCAMPTCPPHEGPIKVGKGCCDYKCSPKGCEDIACAMVVTYCGDKKPQGCCPCTPGYPKTTKPINPCAGIACTMQIRYCDVSKGETPQNTGCCPCTMPETA